jgi:hypothetical protein
MVRRYIRDWNLFRENSGSETGAAAVRLSKYRRPVARVLRRAKLALSDHYGQADRCQVGIGLGDFPLSVWVAS